MTTDIIEVGDFIVLIDSTDTLEADALQCRFHSDILGISFYGSGTVETRVSAGSKEQSLEIRKGMAISYVGNNRVQFAHHVLPGEPLMSVSIFSTLQNLKKLAPQEKQLFDRHLGDLLESRDDFRVGPHLFMAPEMQTTISKIAQTTLTGSARLLFLKSQVLELLAYYFDQIEEGSKTEFNPDELNRMLEAQKIIMENMSQPPSLSELSRMVGVNSNKLKKNFKQIFGIPVFKYLQLQRLQKAHQLLKEKEISVQEAAWQVGYESMGSFSNAFYRMYGFRPSALAK